MMVKHFEATCPSCGKTAASNVNEGACGCGDTAVSGTGAGLHRHPAKGALEDAPSLLVTEVGTKAKAKAPDA